MVRSKCQQELNRSIRCYKLKPCIFLIDSREGLSSTADLEFFNVGAEARIHLIKAETEYGNGIGTIGFQGPSAGIDIGLRSSTENSGISAMAELSVAKAEGTLGPLYGSVGLNANTGFKLGDGGVEANALGFGVTLGVRGKWTINTPFGSLGGSTGAVCVPVEQPLLVENLYRSASSSKATDYNAMQYNRHEYAYAD